jgi:RNA polymerase sigma-70 factor (ECF subfamily)
VDWTGRTSDELIAACVEAVTPTAWEEFVRRFHPVIAATIWRVARRFGRNAPETVDDLIQETFLKICANRCRILREFHAQTPDAIFAFLKTVAFSVAQDHFRISMATKRGSGKWESTLELYAASAVAGREGLPEAERDLILREIDEQLTTASEPAARERDRRIFWLYYRHGMTARAIAAIPGVGLAQKGVESAIQRLTKHVRLRLAPSNPKGSKGNASSTSL